jgi:hypothetical protein
MIFLGVLFVILVLFMYFTTVEILDKMKEVEKKLGVKFQLVSAGSIKKCKVAVVWLKDEYTKDSFVLDGVTVNKNEYASFVVDGMSMRKMGIESNDIVLVRKEEHLPVGEGSIFVLKVYPPRRNKVGYKLRKPIDFYDCQNGDEETFMAWAERHPELDIEELKREYTDTELRAKIADCQRLGCRLLVSETTRKGKIHYSLHPESRIFGKVEHVIQNDSVEIIEKK